MWTDGIIAVDWGTTNRRAWRLDAQGTVGAEFEDSRGILAVPAGGFPAAVAEVRARLGDLPLLMAGMIGSNRGWVEAPYLPCPADLPSLANGVQRVDEQRAFIVPGLSYVDDGRADVMRGEEVQLFGAVAAGLTPPDSLVCHPGTHNKWARVQDGRVASFRTVMTGEMFSLLKERSILSDWLSGPVAPDEAFRAGVRRGLHGDALTAELFSIRAGILLGKLDKQGAASFASGLLIGADVRTGLQDAKDGMVYVMGRADLTALYAAALTEAGRQADQVDGEEAFLAGITDIARRLT